MRTNTFKIVSIAIILFFNYKLNAQTFEWAKTFGGIFYDVGYSITVDESGNVYTTGFFKGTVDFDPSEGIDNHTSNGDRDIFIQKMDTSGNVIWTKTFGGTFYDDSFSITVDGSGNIYTTGYFQGTVDFDPSEGIDNHTSNGNQDIFIQKMDALGNFLWAKTFGGTSSCWGESITVDGSDNVYITGFFFGTVDFDPSEGVDNHTSNGLDDIFIQKIDASGNFLWAKSFGGSSPDRGQSITVDESGNVYTTGYFDKTVDFDPSTGVDNHTSNGGEDIFIQKMNASGNFLWAKTFGGNSYDYGTSITIDKSGNVYATGHFKGTVDFNPSEGIDNHTSNGSSDIFIQKMDASGNFLWVKTFGGAFYDEGNSITIDESSNIYTTGYFNLTVDFDPSEGVDNHTSNGDKDIFIQKMDASGNFLWAKTFGGISGDVGRSITVDKSGNMYTTGVFESSADLDPSPEVDDHISNGLGDIFIQKINPTSIGIHENSFGGKLEVYPNPTNGEINIVTDTKVDLVEVYDTTGQKVAESTETSINISDIVSGIYFVKVYTEKGNSIKKIVRE